MKRMLFTVIIFILIVPAYIYAENRVSMGYIYEASTSYSSTIDATNNSINVVSPTGFDLTNDGRLSLNLVLTKEFVQEMHEKGIKVTPFLSNHWVSSKAIKVLDNPQNIISDLVKVINEYDLDGINVDIENVSPKYKDKLTLFVKMLKEAMPKGKTVSVAVAANPHRLNNTWLATYDYENLAKYADYLVLMAYDEHGQGSVAGPVASLYYVRKSLEYVLESVSRDKVVLGIPLYGRYWKIDAEAGGDALTMASIERFIKKHKLKPQFDRNSMSMSLSFTVEEGEEEKYGFEAGIYIIWYENETSIKAKLELINEKNIKGAALWALTQEDKSVWNYYKTSLNEKEYESERDIRIRERMAAYERIATKVQLEPNLEKAPKFEKTDLKRDLLAKYNELKEREYSVAEHVLLDEKKYYYLAKKERISGLA